MSCRSFRSVALVRRSVRGPGVVKAVMPRAVGLLQQCVGREQGPGHVGRAVTSLDADLERFARAVEADDVHARVAAGSQGHDLQHVWIRRARARGQARLALRVQMRARAGRPPPARCRTAGRPWPRGAARRGRGRSRRSVPKRRAAYSATSPKRTAPRLKVGATTARAPACSRRGCECLPDLVVDGPAGGADDEGATAGRERQGRRARAAWRGG